MSDDEWDVLLAVNREHMRRLRRRFWWEMAGLLAVGIASVLAVLFLS